MRPRQRKQRRRAAVAEVRREILANGDIIVHKANGSVVRIETEQHKRDRKHFEGPGFDIFRRGHRVPKRVCILGPGINAVKEDAYKSITADEIIAVNYAVLISQCKELVDESIWPEDKTIDSWSVCEFDVDAVPWFKKMFKILQVRRYFSTNTCVGVVSIPTPWEDDQLFTYQVAKKPMCSRQYDPSEGKYHPDTTAIGVAACLLADLGAEYIELCGCDLFGNTYYDGTTRGQPQFDNAPIPNADRLDSCLKYLVEKRGIDIVTLSTTTLKTPREVLSSRENIVEIDDNAGMKDGFNAMQV